MYLLTIFLFLQKYKNKKMIFINLQLFTFEINIVT